MPESNSAPPTLPSAGTVPETVQRLKASVEGAGGQVFGVVNFGGIVKSTGEDVGEIQLVIFGNPKIGAQALSADPMGALRLPGKILVYDSRGGTEMAYEIPADMLAEWTMPPELLQVMADTLGQITTAAAE